jgi:regulatory protein
MTFSEDRRENENIKKPKASRTRKPPKKISEQYLYNAGLAYLEKFPASTMHFQKVMLRKIDRSCRHHQDQNKAHCIALLEKTLQKFMQQGLLNDDLYLQGMVNSLRARGLSRVVIINKLQQKGLKADAIENALKLYNDQKEEIDADFTAAIRFAKRKRLGPFRKIIEANKNKELGALARAGFSFDIAQKIINLTLEEAKEVGLSV